MIEEPYRWVEAIRNRREYIEDQLHLGSPVVLLRYADGLLLATMGRETRKIYEIYDRIALAAIGHPADIEKLRLAAIDLAHIEGFNRAVSDVSLRRLVSFALSPALKSAFEQIFNAPYVARTLLAELGATSEQDFLCKLDYDGSFTRSAASLRSVSKSHEVLGGTTASEKAMLHYLEHIPPNGTISLEMALKLALETWAIGFDASRRKLDVGEDKVAATDIKKVLEEEFKTCTVEAAVLDRAAPTPNKFRLVDDTTIAVVTKHFV